LPVVGVFFSDMDDDMDGQSCSLYFGQRSSGSDRQATIARQRSRLPKSLHFTFVPCRQN
jgi:hypothetical protein